MLAVDQMAFTFPKAEQYAFLYENAHLVMLVWDRDRARFLFLIRGQDDSGLSLDYPGETFTNRVLDTIESIFFVQVQEEGKAEPARYVLGSYFEVNRQMYGAYYQRDKASPDVMLFRIDGEAPNQTLEVIDGEEYGPVAERFTEQHGDLITIQGASTGT